MSEPGRRREASPGSRAGTRREALRAGALAGAALAGGTAAAALIGALARPDRALAQSAEEDDLREFLEAALELEQASLLAYDAVLEGGELDPRVTETLELLRGQEQAHVNALDSALDSLGFDAPDSPAEIDDVEAFADVPPLPNAGSSARAEDLAAPLAKIEEVLIAQYLELAPPLESDDLTRTAFEIAAGHAQHAVALGALRGEGAAALAALALR